MRAHLNPAPPPADTPPSAPGPALATRERDAMNRWAAWSVGIGLGLMLCQYGVIRLAPAGMAVRIVVPVTIVLVPLALRPFRHRIGIWIMFVGLAANLAAILANGGLMPMERQTLVSAVGEAHAARYTTGTWISGSKDVLVAPGSGRLVALGDGLIIRFGGGGIVASPGDVVVWAGLAVLAAEASLALRRRELIAHARPSGQPPADAVGRQAEGGATTRA